MTEDLTEQQRRQVDAVRQKLNEAPFIAAGLEFTANIADKVLGVWIKGRYVGLVSQQEDGRWTARSLWHDHNDSLARNTRATRLAAALLLPHVRTLREQIIERDRRAITNRMIEESKKR